LVSGGIEAVVTVDHTRGNAVALRWLLYDGHGNLVRLMAPDYTLSGFQWRGVWGEVQGSLGAGRGYCANLGHPEDETGLVYMRARYYEPATGRFISEDPSRDGVNWYLYADGNPVNKVDYEGKDAEWIIENFQKFVAPILARYGYVIPVDLVKLVGIFIGKKAVNPVMAFIALLERTSNFLIFRGFSQMELGKQMIDFSMQGGLAGSEFGTLFGAVAGATTIITGATMVAAGLALRAVAWVLFGEALWLDKLPY
jgi:RHS repeat-associated protein